MICETITVFLLHKAVDIDLAYKLKSGEFKCQCNRVTCNTILFSPRLKDSWNVSRAEFGKSLKVNSGHRCQLHNEEVGGVEDSQHTKGEAIDISHKELESNDRSFLRMILEKNFDVVLEYPTFFHCHNN